MRDTFLPLALPDIDKTDLAAVEQALLSGWISSGPRVRQFEQEFARAVDAKHAVATSSATAALHLSLLAAGVKPGDEVITTPYTFAASAEVIHYCQARPVFVDIDKDDFNINPDLLERAISEKTRAILPVHIAGLPADMDRIHAIASRRNLPVIEDAAHAFLASYKGRRVGSLSDFTCFSFYATKAITTSEGGMLCTNDDKVAEHCRTMSLHGISGNSWDRYLADSPWYYEIVEPGFKYNLTDIAAALGLAQLAKAERMWLERQSIAARYNEAFNELAALAPPFNSADSQHAWHLYMLRLNLDKLNIDRDEFIRQLRQRNIGAGVHFIPLHLHPFYRQTYGYQADDFPVSYAEYQRVLSLPIYSKMTADDVADVIDAVRAIVKLHSRS